MWAWPALDLLTGTAGDHSCLAQQAAECEFA
jgi:hypothetical protein